VQLADDQHVTMRLHSCHRREPILRSPERRDFFAKLLEEARLKYHFVVHGYVVMPEHFHLLITDPELGDPSVVLKVVKERLSRQVHAKEKKAALKSAGKISMCPHNGKPRCGGTRPLD
jgi:putative transposase